MWQCFGTLPSICHVVATDIAVLRDDAALPALLTVLFTEGDSRLDVHLRIGRSGCCMRQIIPAVLFQGLSLLRGRLQTLCQHTLWQDWLHIDPTAIPYTLLSRLSSRTPCIQVWPCSPCLWLPG